MRRFCLGYLALLLAVLLLPALPLLVNRQTLPSFASDPAPAAPESVVVNGEEQTLTEALTGTLAACVPDGMEPEALHAFAVLLHSDFASRETENRPFSEELPYLSPAQRKNRFSAAFCAQLEEAAALAASEQLCIDGIPIPALFHAISNGHTESPEELFQTDIPGYSSVSSEGDSFAEGYRESITYTKAELSALLTEAFPNVDCSGDPASWILLTARTPAGYVKSAEIGGVSVTGMELREALHLKSSDLSLEWSEDRCTITTLGQGHGVGFSLAGADYFAAQGQNYAQILAHYFPDCTLESV
jgi:stage II sporulation protein D